jgi:hypothetical protein
LLSGLYGHQHVDQDDVRLEGRHGVERFRASRKRGHLMALTSKEVAQQLPHMRLIVDDHDTARSYTSGHASWPQVVEVMERIKSSTRTQGSR